MRAWARLWPKMASQRAFNSHVDQNLNHQWLILRQLQGDLCEPQGLMWLVDSAIDAPDVIVNFTQKDLLLGLIAILVDGPDQILEYGQGDLELLELDLRGPVGGRRTRPPRASSSWCGRSFRIDRA